jgi:hypothetical protein
MKKKINCKIAREREKYSQAPHSIGEKSFSMMLVVLGTKKTAHAKKRGEKKIK